MEPHFGLRLADLQIFTTLERERSLTKTAQIFDRAPATIRAALLRLERELGTTLFSGDEEQLELTGGGARLRPIVDDILARARSLDLEGGAGMERERLTFSLPTFIAEVLLPHLARSPAFGAIRCLSVPQMLMSKYAELQLIDAAITVGSELEPPPGWSSSRIGEVRYGLFASPRTARVLGESPSVDDVQRHRFVAPVYVLRTGELIPGDDGCPLPRRERNVGHEVENMTLACRVAAESDQLVYGPALATAPFVTAGQLTEVAVPGWSKCDPIYCASDRGTVRSRLRDELASAIEGVLGAPSRPSGVIAIETAAAMFDLATGVRRQGQPVQGDSTTACDAAGGSGTVRG